MRRECPDCGGRGNFGRIGASFLTEGLVSRICICETCQGEGEIEDMKEAGDE